MERSWEGCLHNHKVFLVKVNSEFGPGNPGYLGERGWQDTDQNGIMDAISAHYTLYT